MLLAMAKEDQSAKASERVGQTYRVIREGRRALRKLPLSGRARVTVQKNYRFSAA